MIGTFDAEKVKQGKGTYVWMGAADGDEEGQVQKAKYEGNYKDGARNGFGKMDFPGGDSYEGEWLDGKVSYSRFLPLYRIFIALFYLKFNR